MDVGGIAERLAAVRRAIDEATARAGRDPGSVRLIAVSKTQPAEAITAAYAAGQRDFGENYVQELTAKADALRGLQGLRWHAIGALQRNKVRDVARVATTVHAVDRIELATELRRRAEASQRVVEALVEVSVAGEAQKAGCTPADARAIVDALSGDPWVRVVGLMAVPPLAEDPEATRPHFRALRLLRDALRGDDHDALKELSMGMSGDFAVAIEEGATMVRVGTAIFGARAAAR
jgi:pyridoxal phosphate enzyme (YggS family)